MFSCLDEGDKCQSAYGHYTLGMFDIQNENYETVKVCLAELAAEISEMDFIEIYDPDAPATEASSSSSSASEETNNQQHATAGSAPNSGHAELWSCRKIRVKIIKYIAGDLKSIAIMKGTDSANANHACPWCIVHKFAYQNPVRAFNEEYSMLNEAQGARRDHNRQFHLAQPDGDRKGYKNPGIDFGIDFHMVVADTLHTYIRISNTLFEALIHCLITYDDDHGSDFLNAFADYFSSLKIRRPILRRGRKSLELRAYTGEEYKKIWDLFDISVICSEENETLQKMKEVIFNEKYFLIC